jgi:heme/copper-type cytochrome/quinol oxidase subunit 4
MDKNNDALKASEEQVQYANVLMFGVLVGLVVMGVTYFIYLTGLLPAHVDMSYLPQVWGKNVTEYLHLTQTPHGWEWTQLLMKGDFLNYIGFVLLGLMTVVCYMLLVRGYMRQKDWTYATISILEILVLCVAASGILGGGGH